MKKKLSLITLIALLLGAAFGSFFKPAAAELEFIGTIYINLLKFMIGPVIFTSIAVTAFDSAKKKSGLVGRAIITFVIMFVATFLLTSAVVLLIDPAKGFVFDDVDWNNTTTEVSLSSIIVNLFPNNLVTIFAENKLFAIILFSYALGYCASKVNDGRTLIELIRIIRDIFYKMLEYIMYLTPLAVFSLISATVAKYGTILFGVGVRYILTAYLAGALTLLLIMILPVWLFTGMSPLEFVRKIYRIWLITLTTCSSAATLPTTLRICKEELNTPAEVADIVVPLGCTIHMCGGAVSFVLLGLFCSRLYGIEVTVYQYLLMIVSAVLINMSAPGIPNGGVVIGASYLQMLGIPLGFIGFYSGIYKILDMLYTTLNVTGDITANVLLSRKKEK